ncbi:hypothetical protein [Laspinema olomoucense]|uniref:hypothetical protein n=1 Tax=Laspinema olomoucense TaxID=3231600 RepID=UPI0021BACD7C|nr:hypothetical protein [Laspinema sp. D3c]MCT7997216.1 hypothetical protein [Laspinema sp. D3c]
MTRFIHDQFAKQYLEELLSPFGTVETGKTIAAEVQEVDVLFIANPESNRDRSSLGLLGQIADNQSIFEPFRNAVQPKQIRSCLAKLYAIQSNEERKANRDNTPLPEEEVITGWILTPTASSSLLDYFGATEDPIIRVKGVYSLARGLKMGLIAIHQLPVNPETLSLRLLGKGRVQQQAVNEIQRLPDDNPWKLAALELLYNLRTILEVRQDLEPDDQELIMELSPLYLQRLEDATQRGRQEGLEQGVQRGIQQGLEAGVQQGNQQGQRLMVESMLQVKFGEVDAELAQIIDGLIELPALERTQLIMQLSRDEILARFANN